MLVLYPSDSIGEFYASYQHENQIIEMVSHKENFPIFSFGIGYGASEHLVRGAGIEQDFRCKEAQL